MVKNSIIIRKLSEKDLENYKNLRKKALSTDPDAFLATLQEEMSQNDEQIKEQLQQKYFVGAFDGEKLIGTLFVAEQPWTKFKHIGILGGLFVDPEYRKQGIAKQLLTQIIEYSKNQKKFYSLQLKVVTTNTPAIKLYESAGFKKWAEEKNALHINGVFMDQFHYELVLKK